MVRIRRARELGKMAHKEKPSVKNNQIESRLKMYRVYLYTADQQVHDQSSTPDQATALAAFAEMVGRTELDGQKLAAIITYQHHHVATHKFYKHPGQTDYWRNRVDEVEFE